MATEIKRRRGTTAEHSTFTGAPGELTVDTDKNAVVVHDGATAGGNPQLTEADIGSTVQAYDENTAKFNAPQIWTAPQLFVDVTGSTVIVTSPGTAQSVELDGRCHVIELEDGVETTITGLPAGGGFYSSAIVRIKGSAAGTGTIAWPAGHVQMNSQALNATAGAYTDFILDSHDGTVVLYRGVGVEP
jgi:hypothetical protein